MHLPILWRFRLLRKLKAGGRAENRKLLGAWAEAEGGTSKSNPLNTTMPWPGSTIYNTIKLPGGGIIHVWNYPNGAAGIAATAATLVNGHYNGIVRDLRSGAYSAVDMVKRNAGEFNTWGTGAARILVLLNEGAGL